MTDTAANVAIDAPPPPPREVTPAVRRRAWLEPRVRMWWLAALAVLVIAGYFAVTQYLAWRSRADLITRGIEVQAEVLRADSPDIRGRFINPGEMALIRFTHGGQLREHRATFPVRLPAGDTRPVHVDPDDPSRWTLETEVPPLGRELVVLWFIAPLIPIVLGVAWLRRRGVVNLWRNGAAHRAIVVDARPTAFSPLSRAVRCTLADVSDKRVITVTIPTRKLSVTPGDGLFLLALPDRYDKAVAARAFE